MMNAIRLEEASIEQRKHKGSSFAPRFVRKHLSTMETFCVVNNLEQKSVSDVSVHDVEVLNSPTSMRSMDSGFSDSSAECTSESRRCLQTEGRRLIHQHAVNTSIMSVGQNENEVSLQFPWCCDGDVQLDEQTVEVGLDELVTRFGLMNVTPNSDQEKRSDASRPSKRSLIQIQEQIPATNSRATTILVRNGKSSRSCSFMERTNNERSVIKRGARTLSRPPVSKPAAVQATHVNRVCPALNVTNDQVSRAAGDGRPHAEEHQHQHISVVKDVRSHDCCGLQHHQGSPFRHMASLDRNTTSHRKRRQKPTEAGMALVENSALSSWLTELRCTEDLESMHYLQCRPICGDIASNWMPTPQNAHIAIKDALGRARLVCRRLEEVARCFEDGSRENALAKTESLCHTLQALVETCGVVALDGSAKLLLLLEKGLKLVVQSLSAYEQDCQRLRRSLSFTSEVFNQLMQSLLESVTQTLLSAIMPDSSVGCLKSYLRSLLSLISGSPPLCRIFLAQGAVSCLTRVLRAGPGRHVLHRTLRALTVITAQQQGVREFEKAGTLDVLSELLGDLTLTPTERSACVAVLCQVTRPRSGTIHKLQGIGPYLQSIVPHLTDLYAFSSCERSRLLAVTTLANLILMEVAMCAVLQTSGTARVLSHSVLHDVCSIQAKEQIGTILAGMAAVPESRSSLLSCGGLSALLRLLNEPAASIPRDGPTTPSDETLVCNNRAAKSAERTSSRSSDNVSSLPRNRTLPRLSGEPARREHSAAPSVLGSQQSLQRLYQRQPFNCSGEVGVPAAQESSPFPLKTEHLVPNTVKVIVLTTDETKYTRLCDTTAALRTTRQPLVTGVSDGGATVSETVQHKAAAAICRLCSDSPAAVQLVALGGLQLLIQRCRATSHSAASRATILACLSALRKVATACGLSVFDVRDADELILPPLLDSMVLCSRSKEHYV